MRQIRPADAVALGPDSCGLGFYTVSRLHATQSVIHAGKLRLNPPKAFAYNPELPDHLGSAALDAEPKVRHSSYKE